MLLALRVLLKASPQIMAKLPNSNEFLIALDAAILAIQTNSSLQQENNNDLIEQRNKLHDSLVQDTLEIQRKMRPYAAYRKNESLFKFLDFTKTNLNALADVKLTEFAKSVYNKVEEHSDELGPYGFSADTQAAYMNEITLYEIITPEVKIDKQDQHNVTVLLSDNFATADEVIENFDMLVEIVRTSDVKFYADYKAIRKVDASYSPVQLVAQVNDAETGAGVPNATATITLNGSTKDLIVKQSAAKGGFQVKTIAPGIYTVVVTKIGYQTQTITITLMGDKPYSLEIMLVKG